MQRDIQFFVNTWIFGGVTLAEVVRRPAAIGRRGPAGAVDLRDAPWPRPR